MQISSCNVDPLTPQVYKVKLGLQGIPQGALAGQLCTNGRTKDYKNYPKQCVRHF